MTTTHSSTRSTGTVPSRLYLITGLVIAFGWFRNGNAPAWEHAVRALVLLFVGLPAAQIVVNRAHKRSDGGNRIQLRHLNILIAKLTLVAAALIAQVILEPMTSQASLIVSAGIVVVAIGLGPRLHPLFVRHGA